MKRGQLFDPGIVLSGVPREAGHAVALLFFGSAINHNGCDRLFRPGKQFSYRNSHNYKALPTSKSNFELDTTAIEGAAIVAADCDRRTPREFRPCRRSQTAATGILQRSPTELMKIRGNYPRVARSSQAWLVRAGQCVAAPFSGDRELPSYSGIRAATDESFARRDARGAIRTALPPNALFPSHRGHIFRINPQNRSHRGKAISQAQAYNRSVNIERSSYMTRLANPAKRPREEKSASNLRTEAHPTIDVPTYS